MIKFGETEKGLDNFTISVLGDKAAYIHTIKSLLYFICRADESSAYSQLDLYYICNLIEGMLPNEKQIISLEEYEIFQQFKAKKLTNNL